MGNKIMNKQGELKSMFFAVIVASMVIIAIGIIITEWSDHYSAGIGYDLGEYEKLDEVSGQAESHQGRLSPSDPDAGDDFESNTFRGGYGVISNMYAPFRVVFGDGGMLDAVTERIGLPDYIRQGIVTLMILSITFTIVAIIFRLSRRSA